MTKYLRPLTGCDSENVRDFKRAIDEWKKESSKPHPTKIWLGSDMTDDELREIGDYFEETLDWRPAEVVGTDGSPRAVPP